MDPAARADAAAGGGGAASNGEFVPPELLVEGLAAAARVRREQLLDLAEAALAEAGDVQVLESPQPATVMARFAACRGEQCVAEVVLTPARVRVDGQQAWAVVLGWDEQAALAAAVVAALRSESAKELAREALGAEAEHRRAAWKTLAATRMEVA